MNRDVFYTVPEAAKILGVSQTRVRQLLRDGTIEGERSETTWNISKQSLHSFRDTYEPKTHRTEPPQPQSADVQEALDKVEALQRELGRFEGRLELEVTARSTLEESLERERERADQERHERIEAQKAAEKLREELEEARLSWWRRLFR
jgi:excisionase family DNA binding protein